MPPARGRYCVGSEPVPGYVLTGFLGRGQFGDVWKAAGPGKNDVALKIIDLTGGEGSRELAALQQIKSVHHPNLMPIFASWLKDATGQVLDDQTASTATEFVVAMGLGSKSLFERLAQCTREGKPGIPLDELLDYMEGAARGIDYLNQPIHDLGHGPVPIIHGDIKPHNLLVVGNAVQVCDFGLARAVENLRMTQTALGTCAYASAELLYGRPHRASDQYCLAISYTELRTGALPFDETNAFQVADRHREGNLDFSRLPPGEREVIQRATALVPDERWPCCCDMVRALRRAIEAEEEQPVAPPRHETGRAAKKRDATRPGPGDRESDAPPALPSASSVQGTLLPPSSKAAGQRSTDSSQVATRTLAFRPSSAMPAAQRPSRLRRAAKVCAAMVLVVGLGVGVDLFFGGGVSHAVVGRLAGLFAGDQDRSEPGQTASGSERSPELEGQSPASVPKTTAPPPPPPPRRWDAAALDQLIRGGRFGDAAAMLDKAPPEQQATLGERILKAWSADLERRWRNQEWPDVRDSCGALLARWPRRAEERVLRCRADVRLGDHREAIAELKELEPIEPVPESLRPLCLALALVAEYGTSSIVADQPGSVADRLLALDAAARAGQPSFWSPDTEELKQIEKIRADVDKTLLKTVRRQLSPEQLSQAKQSLEKVGTLLGDKSDNPEVARWRVVILAIDACRRKDAAPGEVRAALEALAKLVPGGAWPEDVDAAVAGEIAAALGDVAGKAHAPSELSGELDTALVLAGAAWRVNRLDDRVATSLRRLWEKRIEICVTEPRPVTKEAFSRFEADWKVFERAEERSSLVDAWRAECLIELDRPGDVPDSLREPKPGELPELMTAYVRYVRARALRIAAQDGLLDDAVAELARALEGGTFPPEALKARGRLDHVAALMVEASKRRRTLAGAYQKLDKPPRNPFLGEAGYYAVLRRLAGLKLDALAADQQREIAVALVLAGWGDAGADVALARSAAAGVLQLADADLAPDAVPVVYACVASYLTSVAAAPLSTEDRRNAVAGCARLLAVLRGRDTCAGTLTDEYAATFYGQVIQPILAMAQSLEQAGDAGVAAEALYAGVGQVIWDHRYAAWPVDNKDKTIEDLFGSAIAACEKKGAAADQNRLAEYYVQRGRARLEAPASDRERVIADATAALAKADLFGAHGLLAHAYLLRSRAQPQDADRLKDLDLSVQSGQQAVAKCPPKDRSLPNYLVNLSCAYLEHANYSHGSDRRGDDLRLAVESAERAKSLAQGNPDFPYLALGNAYEDLAWIVREKPAENYPKAIQAFKDASDKQHFPAAALCSLARCYYKMVVDSGLDPAILKDPKLTTGEQVLDECGRLLASAVQLKPDLVEACYYLGRVHLSRKRYAEADRWFEAAKTQAGKQKSLDCVGYAEQWARFPLVNADLKTPDEQYQQALDRAAQIEKMDVPPALAAGRKRAVAGIRGEMFEKKKQFAEAVAAYGEILPKDPSQAQEQDVRLLLARARANLQWLKSEWKPSTAEAVIQDGTRAAALAVAPMEKATAYLSTAGAHCVAYCQKGGADLDPFVASLTEAVSLSPSGPVGLGCRKQAVAMLIVAVTSPQGEKTPKAIAEKQRLYALIVPWQREVVTMSENPSEKKDAGTLLEKADTLLATISIEGVDYLMKKAQDTEKDATVALSADERRLLQQCLPWQKKRLDSAQTQEKENEKNRLGWLEHLQGKAKP